MVIFLAITRYLKQVGSKVWICFSFCPTWLWTRPCIFLKLYFYCSLPFFAVSVCCRHQQQVSKLKCENEALKEQIEAANRHLVTVSDSRLQLEKSLEQQKLSVQRLQRELECDRRTHAKEVLFLGFVTMHFATWADGRTFICWFACSLACSLQAISDPYCQPCLSLFASPYLYVCCRSVCAIDNTSSVASHVA